ncbi:hypothetical protein MtrunA17_Chr8g0371091 [Medicago truncatula]|uniref:Uncharacterized protein n=1 Tax=Medicago truncatula TaxID=3880 RepID=A0A396GL98_MEDTR|nr:hypothetical protein MtrunA17_Chr8g0371091 [Medicago truncatula]
MSVPEVEVYCPPNCVAKDIDMIGVNLAKIKKDKYVSQKSTHICLFYFCQTDKDQVTIAGCVSFVQFLSVGP